MPHHDPVPRRRSKAERERAALEWVRYRRMMTWMALLAAVTAALSLLYLYESGSPLPIHLVIATIAGIGLTVLVGTGLMGLMFLSHRSGHDDEVARGDWNDDGRN